MNCSAVTFDFGQTLCDLDTSMLARRLGERDVHVPATALDAKVTEAWAAYDAAIRAGLGGHPWKILMHRLLVLSGVPADLAAPAVDFLWTEQPRRNLWRRPNPGMIEVVRDLRASGRAVGIVSNSEGHLEDLCAELGWRDDFGVVADSGRLGIEKPDAAIFRYAAGKLGASLAEIVHVGDSFAADVQGALGAGMQAVVVSWAPGRTASA